MKAPDITGQRFGFLTVARRNGADAKGSALWLCLCDCGGRKTVPGHTLRSERVKSCGCWKIEYGRQRGLSNKKHGHVRNGTKTETYRSWSAMWDRCSNPELKDYPRYGGRGITVCDRWKSFEAFLHDMGNRPKGKTLDRINNDGIYEPDNCRWATIKQQNENKPPQFRGKNGRYRKPLPEEAEQALRLYHGDES